MARSRDFHIMAGSLPGFAEPGIARAAIRAGEMGFINGEAAPSESTLRSALAELRDCPRERCVLRLDLEDPVMTPGILENPPPHVGWIILAHATSDQVTRQVPLLHGLKARVLVEVINADTATAAERAGADGVIANGNEAGGRVGEDTTFILLQRLRLTVSLPIWVQGGIGPHTITAAFIGGAAGVVLDSPLALLAESPLPPPLKARIASMDGTEAQCREVMGHPLTRVLSPRGIPLQEPGAPLPPLGQDACFAHCLAERYGTVGRALRGLRTGLVSHLRSALSRESLAQDSGWASAHRTHYPIAQGPMTRVSDSPEFAEVVASAGGLPFLALGVLRGTEIDTLLADTRLRLGDRSWGVGLLGFIESPLREEQVSAVLRHHPAYALIAGGQPEQARLLEREGILTYLHVPTPGLLRMFIEEGARRFVFEGRECGGHVGPLSSFVLWEQAAQVLLDSVPVNELASCHILLAGGIHDALSSAMAVACMADLAERGVKIGVLMGTAYLFTLEAVTSGAIRNTFQQQALACRDTLLLETGPGHVVRCAPTPYTAAFAALKSRLCAEQTSPEALRLALESLNIGRLRLAAKGVTRRPGSADELTTVDEHEQHAEGLFMLGQAAGLRREVLTVEALHRDVSVGGSRILREAADTSDQPLLRAANREGIAIVGMSCLLPGARDLNQFWTNVLTKTNSIREVPASRWDWKPYFDEQRETPDRIYARWGGFLDPIPFDPARYGMPPSSLSSIEPIQLLALEAARDALQDAGYEDRPFPRENTSVIIGVSGGLAELGQNYVVRSALTAGPGTASLNALSRPLPEWTEDSFAGILLNVIAGRITNRFDLGGPSFAVDAACASSLAAVYLACRELESGASDMSLVGGADTFQTPFNYLCFCKTQALSPRGRCRTFDHAADGTCISEGLSMLVLKRISDAERDGDRIYAVIRGVGASSDGRAKGLTAPSPEGQIRALHRAYAQAHLSPATIGLVEAHGTGTVAGDRAEAESLRRVFEAAGAATHSVALGSVKSMIGHTKGAAGVTGLLKMALALHHKVLPATLGVEKPNDCLTGGALYANAETRPWMETPDTHPRRAAVSAFGFGGANYHAIIEEYDRETPAAASAQWPCELFLWRDAEAAEILRRTDSLLAALKAGARPTLKDLSYTLWQEARQRTGGSTLALVATSLDDLTVKLERLTGKLHTESQAVIRDSASGVFMTPQPLARNGGIAFLFPGQGSQYPDMLRELAVHFHEVREAFEAADQNLNDCFEQPLSSFVFPPPRFNEEEERSARQALMATNIAQPALGATAVGLLNLLASLGVRPEFAAGHSYGEYSALCAAGCISPGQLFRLSEARGRFILEEGHGDLGTMAAVEADEATTRELAGDLPGLWIANLNSPRQTVISGTKAAVAEALSLFEKWNLTAQPIPVACAFHTPLMEPAKHRLDEWLEGTRFEAPALRVFSNTTGGEYADKPELIKTQLCEHLVSPVRFVAELEAMHEAGARVFVEVGPRSVVSGLTEQILGDRERIVIPLETRKRSGLEALLFALAQLAAHGAPVQLDRLFEGRQPRRHDLVRLLEETHDAPLPATTWWVDGGSATPIHSGGKPIPCVAPPRPPLAPSAPGPGDLPALLSAHEQVMQRLLDTHRRVMAAALGKPDASPIPVSTAFEISPMPPPAASADMAAKPGRSVTSETPVVPPSPPPAAQICDADQIKQEVLRIVGERTGYPPEMLDVEADLEADLGIDSIKRVEIAGRLRKAFPHLGATPDASPAGNLASLRTLRGLIERIASVPLPGGSAPVKPETPLTPPDGKSKTPAITPPEDDIAVPRFMMRLEDAPAQEESTGFPHDRLFLITDDEAGLASGVAAALTERGARAVVISAQAAKDHRDSLDQVDFTDLRSLRDSVASLHLAGRHVAGIIHLRPLRRHQSGPDMTLEAWRQALQEDVKALFHLAQAAAGDLNATPPASPAWILAAVPARDDFPGHGGLSGLINSLATEWPGLTGRTVALADTDPLPVRVQHVIRELLTHDGVRFASYTDGRRKRVHIERADLAPGPKVMMNIGRDWVVLITGGACGITAQAAMELAEQFKPTLILTGRTALPADEEAGATRGIESPAELRRLLAREVAGSDGKPVLADLEAAYHRLCREREIRATLAAIRKTGARVTYLQTDVRDAASFGAAIQQVYTSFGRLDGVIHGAGVIEDKRVEDKSPESFDRVFDTKADGAFILARNLRLESLKFLVFFSSVATLGNAGQSDYAAANGVLNALARDLNRRMQGRAVALLWGPWRGAGMASEEVTRRFKERGVQIIPPKAGRRSLVAELLHGAKGDVEVLLGDAPYATPTIPVTNSSVLPLIGGVDAVIHNNGSVEVACVLDPSRQSYLRDHQLDGKPVFPAAMAMELMAESAWAASQSPGGVIEISSLQLQQGIVLAPSETRSLRVRGTRLVSDSGTAAFSMQIFSETAGNRAHYRALVTLNAEGQATPVDPASYRNLNPFPLTVAESYDRRLFQRGCFAGITSIEGIGRNSIAGLLHSTAPAACLPAPPESRWLIDPTVVDASLQLVILWERNWHDMTPLPMQINRFRLFGVLSAQPVRCLVTTETSDEGAALNANIYYSDTQGRLLAILEGLQCACSKTLNRLSVTALPAPNPTHPNHPLHKVAG